jgi:hypothetical protein
MEKSHETSLPKCYFDEFDNLVSENELLKKGILCEVIFDYLFIKAVTFVKNFHFAFVIKFYKGLWPTWCWQNSISISNLLKLSTCSRRSRRYNNLY